ncbi:hypothetical protein [Kutzneria sp. 744]|uniref:hypothetical protein n=1 Tax=Kutzneria sp. (strain 744) TaxID=345341 RepID=UPI0003EEDBF5|nr:hypothetical protein [Kutzneria sp. 744]EWM19688.1 hypothetical protein KUTG_09992 [Kutzneria sp. 744]
MAESATHLSSIQGEQCHDTERARATEDAIDDYVESASEWVLACRERGVHEFPTIKEIGIAFTAVNRDGLFVREVLCTRCGLAVRTENWEGFKRGRRSRFRKVSSDLRYLKGRNGERYLAPPGQGRMTPRQIADAIASKVLHDQSLVELRKSLKPSE